MVNDLCVFRCGLIGLERVIVKERKDCEEMMLYICNECYGKLPIDFELLYKRQDQSLKQERFIENSYLIKEMLESFFDSWIHVSHPSNRNVADFLNRSGCRTQRGQAWTTANIYAYLIRHYEGMTVAQIFFTKKNQDLKIKPFPLASESASVSETEHNSNINFPVEVVI